MIKHFKSDYGECDYDDSLFKQEGNFLKYIGESCDVVVPTGLSMYGGLFEKRTFKDTLKVNCDFSGNINSDLFRNLFEYCIFEHGVDLSDFCKNASYEDIGVLYFMFGCVIKEKLIFADNFIVGDRSFCYSEFLNGANLGSVKMFSGVEFLGDAYLSDDFYLPDIKSADIVFDTVYEGTLCCPRRMPSYVMSEEKCNLLYAINNHIFDDRNYERQTEEVCYKQYGHKIDYEEITKYEVEWDLYSKKIKEKFGEDAYSEEGILPLDGKAVKYLEKELSIAVEKLKKGKGIVSRCKQEMVKLLKEGKSEKEAISILSKNPDFNVDLCNTIYTGIENSLIDKCSIDISSIFRVENDTSVSKYTVGEMKELLMKRGYPELVVLKCLVDYLKDEYLCL